MEALPYAEQLISYPSVSCESNVEVTEFVERFLRDQDFEIERIDYDDQGTQKSNVIGKRGRGTGGLAFFGHTDVVPADDWTSRLGGPFKPVVTDGRLIGRGSCDMKGPVACVMAAVARYRDRGFEAPLYVACTADEEVGYTGAKEVVARSAMYREMAAQQTGCVITEPTKLEVVHGHKGTCGFQAIAKGEAAHSSTDEGLNANLAMIPFLAEMKKIYDEVQTDPAWRHDEFDPPTISWNIGINDHTHAVNIKAAKSVCTVYFRPMPGQSPDGLLDRVEGLARQHGLELNIFRGSGPVYVDPESDYVQKMVRVARCDRSRTVAYGTDGGVLTELKNLVVLGPGDIAQAHTTDEWISLDQLKRGTELYAKLIDTWCC